MLYSENGPIDSLLVRQLWAHRVTNGNRRLQLRAPLEISPNVPDAALNLILKQDYSTTWRQ